MKKSADGACLPIQTKGGAGKGDKKPLTPMNTGWLGKKRHPFHGFRINPYTENRWKTKFSIPSCYANLESLLLFHALAPCPPAP